MMIPDAGKTLEWHMPMMFLLLLLSADIDIEINSTPCSAISDSATPDATAIADSASC
jgi:hypothetical protein